jgi:glyoxylase-like metal-dependent hydrolase (beta-lactamase superfamily II)
VNRRSRIAAAVFFTLVGLTGTYLYGQATNVEIERVTDSVHVISGVGGNVSILKTDQGAVVVDAMLFPIQGRRIKDLAERLGGGPTQAILKTHYHDDHSHGSQAWAPGTRIVSTDRTRAYTDHFDRSFWGAEEAATASNETFEDSHEMRIGGKTIRSFYLGRGHTGGDLVVLFVEDRVLHAGDLFFNQRYPSVDLEAGGSVQQWAKTLDRVLALDFDKVIPGHGPVSDRRGLQQFQRFIAELSELAENATATGMTLSETLASQNLESDAGFKVMSGVFFSGPDRDSVIQRAWEEASRVVVSYEPAS